MVHKTNLFPPLSSERPILSFSSLGVEKTNERILVVGVREACAAGRGRSHQLHPWSLHDRSHGAQAGQRGSKSFV